LLLALIKMGETMEVHLVAYTQFSPKYVGYDADDLVALAMRSCHSKKAMHELINQKEKKETARRIRFAKKVGHFSVLEHANFTFSISGISRVCCYDEKTEVLTADGWKLFKQVVPEDLFCTLNPKTHEIEYQQATNFFAEQYNGKMYYLHSTKVNLMVTPNHRMYIYPFDTQRAKRAKKEGKNSPSLWMVQYAEDIAGKRVAYKSTAKWSVAEPAFFNLPSCKIPCGRGERSADRIALNANLFAEFFGYYLSEGHLNHAKGGSYSIVISNSDDILLSNMCRLIKKMMFKPHFIYRRKALAGVVFSSYQMYHYLKQFGKAGDKYIPREILLNFGQNQCNILLRALIAGDGSTYFKRGPWRYYTSSKRLADNVQELALKAGYAASVRTWDRIGQWHNGPCGNKICFRLLSHVVTILMRQNVPLVNHNGKQNDKWTKYDGTVYCVTVPNGLLYVRRNGKAVWCGNSHQLVRHRLASYSQISIRAVDPEGLNTVLPPTISGEQIKLFTKQGKSAREVYRKLIKAGVPRENARFVLPMGVETHIVVTMNARELLHFCRLRNDERAQWEIRELANRMLALAKQVAPVIFENVPETI